MIIACTETAETVCLVCGVSVANAWHSRVLTRNIVFNKELNSKGLPSKSDSLLICGLQYHIHQPV